MARSDLGKAGFKKFGKSGVGALALAASVAAPFNAMAGDFPPIFPDIHAPALLGASVVQFIGTVGDPLMGNRIASLGGAAAHDWLKALEQEGPTATYRLVVTPRPEFQKDPRFANVVAVYAGVPSAAAWGLGAQLPVCVSEKIGSDKVLGTALYRASDGEAIYENTTPRMIPGGCEAYFKQPDVLQRLVNQKSPPPVAAKSAPRLAGY